MNDFITEKNSGIVLGTAASGMLPQLDAAGMARQCLPQELSASA
ncbi:hypothetical protein [Kerstersia similis]